MNLFKTEKDIVNCEKCKAMLEKELAYSVTLKNFMWFRDYEQYYCLSCKPPYNIESNTEKGKRYWGQIEMNEKGIPVGYIKKGKKK